MKKLWGKIKGMFSAKKAGGMPDKLTDEQKHELFTSILHGDNGDTKMVAAMVYPIMHNIQPAIEAVIWQNIFKRAGVTEEEHHKALMTFQNVTENKVKGWMKTNGTDGMDKFVEEMKELFEKRILGVKDASDKD